jgi:hypothetical protein
MRSKKIFPPGTFIPFPQRLMAIIQLCLVFSLVLWYATQPFMGEYFKLKSHMLLYEYVMGTSNMLKSDAQKIKLVRNKERFTALPIKESQLMQANYQRLYDYSTRSWLTKIGDGIWALIKDVPPFELAWFFFSASIAILLLLKIEGAKAAAWLLPAIALAYGIDNQLTGYPSQPDADAALFPTESYIIQHYLQEPLSHNLGTQQQQLQKGWETYLATKWNKSDETSWELKVEAGEYRFNLARLNKLPLQIPTYWKPLFHQKVSYPLLFFYLGWNLLFAWLVNREIKEPLTIH